MFVVPQDIRQVFLRFINMWVALHSHGGTLFAQARVMSPTKLINLEKHSRKGHRDRCVTNKSISFLDADQKEQGKTPLSNVWLSEKGEQYGIVHPIQKDVVFFFF